MNVNYEVFQTWIKQDLNTAIAALYRERQPHSYHSLANQVLMQAHWYSALETVRKVALCSFFLCTMLIWDHPKSLAAKPSIIGHIALARAFVGQGQQEPAFEAIDAVFRTCGADEIRPLLLIKARSELLFPSDLSL